MLEFIKSITSDNSGGASSSRILMLLWGLGVLVPWIIISIKTGGLVPIPNEAVMILLGLSAAKTVQRFGEKSVETTPITPEPPKQ